jgi:DMSO/TMAO reductase YedYZ heme-binding membrane subunit
VSEQVWWYLSRSSGIVALALLVGSFVWGVLLATRVLRPHDRPAWLLDLHRWLGWMAIVMTGLHLLGLALDGYVDFGAGALFVPGLSPYRPLAVAIGVLALYVLIAVQATSALRRRLPRRLWYRVHLLSYALVWMAAIHAGLAGSDVDNRLYQLLALLLTVAAVAATAARIATPRRTAGDGGTSAAPVRGPTRESGSSVDVAAELGHRAEAVRQ